MARILLVGTATLDMVFELEHAAGADEEMRARSLRVCRGGNAANSAVVLAGLGQDAEFLGMLAEPPAADVIEQDFLRHGVDYRRCPRAAGLSPFSSIYLAGAQRSIVHYRELAELDADAFIRLDLGRFDWVHFEGRNVPCLLLMLAHLRRVHPRIPVSLELEKPRPGLQQAAALADWLLCSRVFARQSGHETPAEFLAAMRLQAPAATGVAAWGEDGAYAQQTDGVLLHAPAVPPAAVVDTLGAGDTFNAAFIHAVLHKKSLSAALQDACRLAGIKCGQYGFDGLSVRC